MAGVRVLISGMGGELGSRIASLLEAESWVGSLEGIDTDPPRTRLRRTVFHRIVPGQHDRIVSEVTRFNPHVLVHLAVWEPHARAPPDTALRLTDDATTRPGRCRRVPGARVDRPAQRHRGLRARRRGSVTRPVRTSPSTPPATGAGCWPRSKPTAARSPNGSASSVGSLRLAPILGPHIPSPLGRFLRMPVVPFSALADPPFAVIHQHDAADAFVAAVRDRLAEPLNIVAPGAVTALQAIRRGRRLPVPLFGPDWAIARGLAYVSGAPLPDHVLEMLHRGRLADNSRARAVLGFTPTASTAR